MNSCSESESSETIPRIAIFVSWFCSSWSFVTEADESATDSFSISLVSGFGCCFCGKSVTGSLSFFSSGFDNSVTGSLLFFSSGFDNSVTGSSLFFSSGFR